MWVSYTVYRLPFSVYKQYSSVSLVIDLITMLLPTDDRSRCRLNTIPGQQGSDYINASLIDVRNCLTLMPPWFSKKIVIYHHCRATTSVMPSLQPKVPCQIPLMTSGGWCGRPSVLPLSCSPRRKRGEGYVALCDGRLMQTMSPYLSPYCRSSVTGIGLTMGLQRTPSSKWSCLQWMSILTMSWGNSSWWTPGWATKLVTSHFCLHCLY